MKYNLLLVIILNCLCTGLYCQTSYFTELVPFSGFIAPHRVGMESLAKNPVIGGDINFFVSHSPDNIFDEKYNSPFIGGGMSFENLGNPEMLGNSYSLYTFMEFRMLKNYKVGLNTRIAGGLSYITKKYDAENNPENIAIGSSISFYFNLHLNLFYPIPDSNFELRLGAGLVHNSNGSVKKPNYGLNQIKFTTGLSYKITEKNKTKQQITDPVIIQRPHEFHIMATLIKTEEYSTDYFGREGNYFCSSFALGYNYRYSHLGKAGISLDMFYNQNLYYHYDAVRDTLLRINDNLKDILRTGISIGHELVYKKLGLITYIGAYTYKKIKPKDHFYFRVGLRYYPIRNMYINLTLKCFGFKAHYIESGIGFSLYGRNRENKR